jgi:hypothetical protein
LDNKNIGDAVNSPILRTSFTGYGLASDRLSANRMGVKKPLTTKQQEIYKLIRELHLRLDCPGKIRRFLGRYLLLSLPFIAFKLPPQYRQVRDVFVLLLGISSIVIPIVLAGTMS